MQLLDALKALEEGKKIKQSAWTNAFIALDDVLGLAYHSEDGGWHSLAVALAFPGYINDPKLADIDPLEGWEVIPDDDDAPTFGFETALSWIKKGRKVARKEWARKEMYLTIKNWEISYWVKKFSEVLDADDAHYDMQFVVRYSTSDKETTIDCYVPTQTDLLATDWYIVNIAKGERSSMVFNVPPCYKCNDRTNGDNAGCHVMCARYQKWRKAKEESYERTAGNRRANADANAIMKEKCEKRRKRMRKH